MTLTPRPTLLVADPDAAARDATCAALQADFDVLEAGDRRAAWRILEDQYVQAVFYGMGPDCAEAESFLRQLRQRWPEVIRIVLSDPNQTEALTAILPQIGPQQVLSRPCPPDLLRMAARNAAAAFDLAREHDRLRLELRCLGTGGAQKMQAQRAAHQDLHGFDKLLRAPNSPMGPIVTRALHFASFDVPVLIQGPPGTGKATMARAIHDSSLRSDQAFVAYNCAGLPEDVVAAALLGTRRGLNSGPRDGAIARADHGTLYLAGLDQLPMVLQRAVLRLLQTQSYAPLGAVEEQTSRLRLIASCDGDPWDAVRAGRLDPDLCYALSVADLALPPLRARRGDIPLLATQMLFDAAARHAKPVRGLTDTALGFLQAYDWPGNLRELQNEVTRMLIFAQDAVLDADLISRHILQAAPLEPGPNTAPIALDGSLRDRVEAMEKRIIRETLTRLKWNKSRAADELGLSRVGLRAKLDRYGIAPTDTREPQEA